jgi:mRNA interferase MazF
MQIKRGEIYWSDLNPSRGSEISKVRPVLIVSNNISNKYSSTITILPITSKTERIYPYEIQLEEKEGSLSSESKVKANQIRTIDKIRIKKKIGVLTKTRMKEIDEAILIHLDIDL